MDKIAAYELLLENHPLWIKEAGTNYSLRGYTKDPTLTPAILKKLKSADKEWWEHSEGLERHGKDSTFGKLTFNVLELGDSSAQGLYTMEHEGKGSTSRFLNNKQLDRIVGMYKKEMSKTPQFAEGHKRFLDRAAKLKKDPRIKGYRLEAH